MKSALMLTLGALLLTGIAQARQEPAAKSPMHCRKLKPVAPLRNNLAAH
jgi:hypothetical protein